MTVNFEFESDKKFNFDYEQIIKEGINELLDYENCPFESDVTIILTTNEEIQAINKQYRGIDNPTDVLSFPMVQYEVPSYFLGLEEKIDAFHPETGELLLGDIIISVDKVYEQAEKYGHSVKRELVFLIVHSMLHLLGYDHMVEQERIIMEKKQSEILSILNIKR